MVLTVRPTPACTITAIELNTTSTWFKLGPRFCKLSTKVGRLDRRRITWGGGGALASGLIENALDLVALLMASDVMGLMDLKPR